MFIIGTVLGIKFMVASAEDKAEVKKALVPYIIGCAVIFGAFTIWNIAVNIGQDVTGAGTTSVPNSDPPETCYRCGSGLSEEELEDLKCSDCGATINY